MLNSYTFPSRCSKLKFEWILHFMTEKNEGKVFYFHTSSVIYLRNLLLTTSTDIQCLVNATLYCLSSKSVAASCYFIYTYILFMYYLKNKVSQQIFLCNCQFLLLFFHYSEKIKIIIVKNWYKYLLKVVSCVS